MHAITRSVIWLVLTVFRYCHEHGILMSPDLPVFSAKVWLTRLMRLCKPRECVKFDQPYLSVKITHIQLLRYSLDTCTSFSVYLLIFKSQKCSSEVLNFLSSITYHRLHHNYLITTEKYRITGNFCGWSIFATFAGLIFVDAHSLPLCTIQSSLFRGFNFRG